MRSSSIRAAFMPTVDGEQGAGVTSANRTRAWEAARAASPRRSGTRLARAADINGAGRTGHALVSAVRDPLSHRGGHRDPPGRARVVSVDDDGLRSLARGFDTLFPASGRSTTQSPALSMTCRPDGSTVALLTTSEMTAEHDADITVGHQRGPNPPWGADVFVPDLEAMWRVLRGHPRREIRQFAWSATGRCRAAAQNPSCSSPRTG